MNTLSSHVLDTTLGKPAHGIALTLTLPDGNTLSVKQIATAALTTGL